MSSSPYVLLDRRLTRANNARVSIFDRGFQYGDALIETLRIDRGRPIALAAHLDRLHRSATALGIPLPERDWHHDIGRLVTRNDLTAAEAWARITVTRGIASRGLPPPAVPEPTVILAVGALDPAIATMRRRGIVAITLDFGRGSALAEHKHPFYLPSIEGRRRAATVGADDGLFIGEHGGVEGGTTSNLFARFGDLLVTPRGGGVLPGITRARTLEAARLRGWRVAERRLRRGEVAAAEEIFLTNALFELVPVVRLDGEKVGAGRPGAYARALQRTLLASTVRL